MHTQTATRTWHYANDNEPDIPFEPPSTTPVAAQTILIVNADAKLTKDAAPDYPNGDFALIGATRSFDALRYFNVDHPLRFRKPRGMINFSNWQLARGADLMVGIPANDLF